MIDQPPNQPAQPGNGYPNEPQVEEVIQTQQVRINIKTKAKYPWVTWVLLGITVILFLLQILSENLLGTDVLMLFGAKINGLIIKGQFWRLLTATFLHGSILHILFNMYALYVIGPGLEVHYGHLRFLMLYLLAGFAGNVVSFTLTASPSLGASTAIFGLIAAQGIFIYRNRFLFGKRSKSLLGNIALIVIFNLAMGLNPGIDNWGHLGGLLGGAAFAWLSGPVLKMRQEMGQFIIGEEKSSIKAGWVFISIGCIFALLVFLNIFLLR